MRLGAVMLDAVLPKAVLWPLQWFSGYFATATTAAGRSVYGLRWTVQAIWLCIGVAIHVIVQGRPLHERGQTWDKRVLSIRIVDLPGEPPPLRRLLVLRYLPMPIVILATVVGVVVALVNPLLIFRTGCRCLHDHIAGTRVVIAD